MLELWVSNKGISPYKVESIDENVGWNNEAF